MNLQLCRPFPAKHGNPITVGVAEIGIFSSSASAGAVERPCASCAAAIATAEINRIAAFRI
jgi:hypothetical protein